MENSEMSQQVMIMDSEYFLYPMTVFNRGFANLVMVCFKKPLQSTK